MYFAQLSFLFVEELAVLTTDIAEEGLYLLDGSGCLSLVPEVVQLGKLTLAASLGEAGVSQHDACALAAS